MAFLHYILAAVFLWESTVLAQLAYNETEVCYDVVGCFNNSAPFNNTNGVLPKSPEELDARIWLFTRDNKATADVLNYTDPDTVKNSHFDPSRHTKVIVHGFSSSFEKTPWIFRMKNKFLVKGDFNVLAVDWSKGATLPDYPQATANIRVVATEVKLVLEIMQDQGLDLGNVHIVGHSLGAHLSGFIGNLLGPNVIGRISGLDPAEPSFLHYTLPVRLDKEDAQFVDVIHTDGSPFNLLAGGYGLMLESGDVDIYVNGGEKQPGCVDGIGGLLSSSNSSLENSVACSHGRAHDIFLESIDTTCNFTAYPCESFDKFENGECFTCGAEGCSSAGYNADLGPRTGKFYVDTHHSPPFCGYPYHVKVVPNPTQPNTTGLIYVSLIGTLDKTDFIPINSKNKKLNGTWAISTNVVYQTDIGVVTGVQLKYVKDVGFLGGLFGSSSTNTYSVASIQVMSPSAAMWASSCRGEFNLLDKQPLDVATAAGRSSDPCTVIG
ncbi:unnamed protein product [Lymnaea stagnalis]|uniref:Lipase domain-containing protein n=1 Tax=Lymnaea stagnalis TaxID=6523 RepID=A0AAV2IB92_LYMST